MALPTETATTDAQRLARVRAIIEQIELTGTAMATKNGATLTHLDLERLYAREKELMRRSAMATASNYQPQAVKFRSPA